MFRKRRDGGKHWNLVDQGGCIGSGDLRRFQVLPFDPYRSDQFPVLLFQLRNRVRTPNPIRISSNRARVGFISSVSTTNCDPEKVRLRRRRRPHWKDHQGLSHPGRAIAGHL